MDNLQTASSIEYVDVIAEEIEDQDESPLQDDTSHHSQIAVWKCLTSNTLFCGIALLPITFAVLILSALGVNYAIAVSLGHVSPFLPYVSWLASQSPEEYIFDFLLSLASINVSFIIYMKFKVIGSTYRGQPLTWILMFNKLCAWMGLATGFFFLMSATFPAVHEAAIAKVHSVASITAFSILCLYFIIESVMSFHIRDTVTGITTCICIARSVIAGLCTVSLIVSGTTGKLSFKKFKGNNPKKWHHSDGGYVLHLVAAFCEWLIVLLMVGFFLTYIAELKHLRSRVRVTLKKNNVVANPDETTRLLI